jgi:polar amino acid transport system substrate-binding protein
MEVDNTYLVPPGSALQTMANVDQPGLRIAVPQRSAPDLFLSRTLRHAELVRSPAGLGAIVELVRTEQAQAVAADRASLLGVAATWPGARVLEERFLAVEHAIATPKDREAGLSYLRDFVAQAKRSGLIQQALERSGVRGVQVAP